MPGKVKVIHKLKVKVRVKVGPSIIAELQFPRSLTNILDYLTEIITNLLTD